MDYKLLSDTQLANLFKSGDMLAFTQIYDRYWVALFNHARRMLKDNEQAQDIVQDVFSSLLNKIEKLEFQTSLSSYLYQTVRFSIIDLIRHEKVKANYLERLQTFTTNNYASTDELIDEKELRQLFEREIALLPLKMRRIFELSRKAHLSYKEIATETNVSEGTVRKQIYYALKILKNKITLLAIFILY
nr:RNA polymerase sigma-70 factor [Pedobacter panaciterrae]